MKNKLPVILPIIILIIGVMIAYPMILARETLPVYTPAMLNPQLVDSSKQGVTKNHRIADFSLINEHGNTFTQDSLKGKFYVTDFFFTTCPNICPDMSSQLVRVQDEYDDLADFMIVSHSVSPEHDTPEILRKYGEDYGADFNKWVFLTGDKKVIYDLARKSYFAATTEGNGGLDDFIHTENFVLVDKKKRIRGFYDGTDPNSVDQLIHDIKVLSREYDS